MQKVDRTVGGPWPIDPFQSHGLGIQLLSGYSLKGQVFWNILIFPILERLRQKDYHKFKSSLGHTGLNPNVGYIVKPCLKAKINKQKLEKFNMPENISDLISIIHWKYNIEYISLYF